MKNFRIIVISNMYPSKSSPNYGVFVHEFVEGLKWSGEVQIKLIVIKGRSKWYFVKFMKYLHFYFRSFFSLLFDRGFFYFHFANHSLLPLVFSPKITMQRVFVNFHGSDLFPQNRVSKILSPISQRISRKVRKVIVPSSYFQSEVIKCLGIRPSKVVVSPSGGVDCSLFSPSIKTSKHSEMLSIGYVGRLDKGKGFDILVEAFEKFIGEGNAGFLHVIGGGTCYDSLLTQTNVKKMQCTNHLKFYGMQQHENLPYYFHTFDVLVFPSLRESLGLVGLEAMACGVPVIGSNIGGISTYVENGMNGFLFEPNDSNDLYAKLCTFNSMDGPGRHSFSLNARNTSLKYDKSLIAKEMFGFLKNEWSL